jgi:putative transcriptional regulator
MTITHHPSDATLAAFASGGLDEARCLVVATHLSLCPQCRNATHGFEEAGGAMLDAVEPTALSAGALQRAMTALGPLDIVSPALRGGDGARELPVPLSHYAVGPWRWIGRGVQWRPVDVASDQGVRVFMLKAAPGTRLPRHRHTGTEWTCVFEGAFTHDLGRYGAGDFDEADDSVEHNPVVDADMGCVCLVALQGGITLQGFLGRLLQPFVRI